MSDLKRKKKIEQVIRAMSKISKELKQEKITDEEYHELTLQTILFVQTLYAKRLVRTQASEKAFGEAMDTLRRIRKNN